MLERVDVISNNTTHFNFVFEAPEGKAVSYFRYYSAGEQRGVFINDIKVEYPKAPLTDVSVAVTQNDGYLGASGADTFVVSNVNVLQNFSGYIKGGDGLDTLKLSSGTKVLDLATLDGRLSSVEIIDISPGTSTLTLGVSQVLENGAVDAFYIGDKSRVQMLIKGNTNDAVNLSDLLANGSDHGDWVQGAAVKVDGKLYDTYQHSALDAELLVQQGVAVTLNNNGGTGAVMEHEGGDASAASAMLTLNLSQVLSEGGVNLFHEGEQDRTQLMVKGSAGDSINLDDLLADGSDVGDWAASGSLSIGGVSYDIYQHSGMAAELLVEESVKVNLI